MLSRDFKMKELRPLFHWVLLEGGGRTGLKRGRLAVCPKHPSFARGARRMRRSGSCRPGGTAGLTLPEAERRNGEAAGPRGEEYTPPT